MSEVMTRPALISAERRMAELLGGRGFDGKAFGPKEAKLPHIVIPQLAPDAIHLGEAGDTGAQIGFDLAKLLDGRLLVQGASGAGKSWTLRRILERTHERIQQVIIDPEEPPWTAAEDELLARVPLYDLDKCAEIFREHGFSRSPTAINIRCKRKGLSRRATRPTYSANQVAKIFGVDIKTVTREILQGDLAATKRADRRLPQQGGSSWDITPAGSTPVHHRSPRARRFPQGRQVRVGARAYAT